MPDATGQEADARAARWSRGIRAGDRAALGSFYEAWFDRALAAARKLTGRDEAFCLDVVQEAMLRVVRSMKPMNTNAHLEAWVLRVVRSACIDVIRCEARRTVRERGIARGGSTEPAQASASRREETAALLRRLRGLGDDDLELVSASAGVGPSLAQIASAREVSADAVGSKARRLVLRLRKESEDDRSAG